MPHRVEANRYIQLTETGAGRMAEAMRKYRIAIDDIAGDRDTPSRNTVKRALRKGPVFLNTLDRIWDYIQRRAAEKRETLVDLHRGEDYLFVESAPRTENDALEIAEVLPPGASKRGWLSRQVPRRNRLFTGRRDVLDRLHRTLKAGPTALDPGPAGAYRTRGDR